MNNGPAWPPSDAATGLLAGRAAGLSSIGRDAEHPDDQEGELLCTYASLR